MSNVKNRHEAFEKYCRQLGLKTLAQQYREMIQRAGAEKPGYFDFLFDVIQGEASEKHKRRIAYLIKKSRLPHPLMLLSDFDFDFQTGVNPMLIKELATLDFLEQGQSILFIGNCGTGKSHLAQSLALIACQHAYRVLYTTCSDLIVDLNTGVFEKTLEQKLKKYIKPELLVIDEMGHDRLELQVVKEAHLLFKVIDQRYKFKRPLIFTTNIEEPDWGEFLGDPVSTHAILDRIFHHSVIVHIKGPSYRKHQGALLQGKYAASIKPT